MIETIDEAEVRFLSQMRGEGFHIWNYANLTLSRPWFLVVTQEGTPEGEMLNTLLLFNVDHLIELQRQVMILEVNLASPKWLNGGDGWQMHPIKRILKRSGKGAFGYLYELENGQQFIDGSTTSKDTSSVELVFSFVE
jgi:hypothetical protein